MWRTQFGIRIKIMNRIKEFLTYLIATKERDARFNEMNHVVIPAKKVSMLWILPPARE